MIIQQALFRGGNYKQYVQVNGVTIPMILIIIDNVSAFNEKTEDQYMGFLITLSKEGVSHGIYLLLTDSGIGPAEIPSRAAENIKTFISTEMADKYAYSDIMHTLAFDVIPEANIKGRGLAYYGNRLLEYQTALACQAEDDYQRIERINRICEDMYQHWTKKRARPIPEIPEKAVWSEFSELEDYEKALEDVRYLPVAYNAKNASIYSIDLSDTYCYMITGWARSGKKNYMKTMIQSAMKRTGEVFIFDSDAKYLRVFSETEGIQYITEEKSIFECFSNMIPKFKERSQVRKEMLDEDIEELEIFNHMCKETPIYFFIPDLEWFINLIYNSEFDMRGFLENILEKGRLLNIYFIGAIGLENISTVSYQRIYEIFAGYKTGIHFGGNTVQNQIFNFDAIPYKEQSMISKPGIGLVSNRLNGEVQQIIVPLARR